MLKNILKYKYIYVFIIILALIGFLSGILYYNIQPSSIKEETKELLNIKEQLSIKTNNIIKRTKDNSKILISSILIIPEYKNILQSFKKPFEIGFIFSLLSSYSYKLSIIYIGTYHILPFIFTLILIRVSISLSYSITKTLIKRDRKSLTRLNILLKKYIIVLTISCLYEIIIFFFSKNINGYLMAFINI